MKGSAEQMTTYAELPNLSVQSEEGLSLAYRDTAGDGRPVLLLQHFRGNLDSWDPALIDELASNRRVITFDYEGVGGSQGVVAHTMAETAAGVLRFLDAMNLEQVDLLGFSIGSFVAQEMALTRPSAVNRVILASSAPKGAPNMHGWAAEVIGAVGTPQTSPRSTSASFLHPPRPARKPDTRPSAGCTPAKTIAIPRRAGPAAWPSTTPCANGGSRTTVSSRGSKPSRCRCSWPTVTAIR